MLQKPTPQSAVSAATNAASPNQVPPSTSGLQPGATGPLAISQITSALKCKLPNCPKPCYMEVNGHVHDFCSKAHAVTYFQQQSQQQSQQPMAQSPGAPTTMSKGTHHYTSLHTSSHFYCLAPLNPLQSPPSNPLQSHPSAGRPMSGKVRC